MSYVHISDNPVYVGHVICEFLLQHSQASLPHLVYK